MRTRCGAASSSTSGSRTSSNDHTSDRRREPRAMSASDVSAPTGPSAVTLVRGLGLPAATSLVVGDVIGTGVFLKARVMTCNVGTPVMVVLVWVVGGLLSLAGALTYAELAARMPSAGGEYVFIREAYGRLWGFLYGWTRFFVASTGGFAGLAAGFAIFLNIASGGRLQAMGVLPFIAGGGVGAVGLREIGEGGWRGAVAPFLGAAG